MTLDQINFAPLEEMHNAWRDAFKQQFSQSSIGVKTLSVLIVVCGVGALFVKPFIGVFCLVALLILIGNRAKKIQAQIWIKFAEANNWALNTNLSALELVPPGLKGFGHGQKISDAITAQFNNLTCNLLTYEYTTGSGKSQQTHYFTIAGVVLPKPFPHIILDGKKLYDGVRNIPDGYDVVNLEGDFSKYFKLYIQKGEQIDALSIITPDVMQVLIDKEQQQDIEIYGNNLYFIGGNDERSPKALRSLLDSVAALAPELLHRAQSLRYSPNSQ